VLKIFHETIHSLDDKYDCKRLTARFRLFIYFNICFGGNYQLLVAQYLTMAMMLLSIKQLINQAVRIQTILFHWKVTVLALDANIIRNSFESQNISCKVVPIGLDNTCYDLYEYFAEIINV